MTLEQWERYYDLTRRYNGLVVGTDYGATIETGAQMTTAAARPATKPGAPRPDPARIFADNLVGQPEAPRILDYINIWKAGLTPPDRPPGIFLLAGPTGVGKTRTVESLALAFHGDPKLHKVVNCGEFQHSHEIAKLIGAPPGYLGHRETTAVLSSASLMALKTSACQLGFLLFDEIEKASEAVHKLLLGVFDKGKLQLGTNETVDFTSTMVFMTTNLGARDLRRRRIGLTTVDVERESHDTIDRAIHKFFAPEFIQRIDETFFYKRLTSDDAFKVLDLLIEEQTKLFRSRMLFFRVSQGAKEVIVREGYSEEFGMRMLKRTLGRLAVVPASMRILEGGVEQGSEIGVEADGRGGCRIVVSH